MNAFSIGIIPITAKSDIDAVLCGVYMNTSYSFLLSRSKPPAACLCTCSSVTRYKLIPERSTSASLPRTVTDPHVQIIHRVHLPIWGSL